MNAVINRRTKSVLIYQGDDLARIEELAEEARSLAHQEAASGPRVLGEGSAAEAAAKAHDDFVTEAESRAVKVVLTEVGRRRWRNLTGEHPARTGNKGDEAMGVNLDTFPEALLKASITEPQFPTADDLADWLDMMNDGMFDRLFLEAFALNRSTSDPKASLVSELMSRNAATSK